METTATVQKLASELSLAFVWQTRNNDDKFVSLRDGSPKWMTEVIHEVHGEKMPDDYIYQFCEKAADAIAECDEDADEDTIREAIQEIEAPCYTHEQMKWFAGNYEYCDQAIEEGLWESGNHNEVTNLVAIGMWLHIVEVGNALLQALTDRAEELEAEETE
jgi:hypothetical protein